MGENLGDLGIFPLCQFLDDTVGEENLPSVGIVDGVRQLDRVGAKEEGLHQTPFAGWDRVTQMMEDLLD
jgi:hypothetical protein